MKKTNPISLILFLIFSGGLFGANPEKIALLEKAEDILGGQNLIAEKRAVMSGLVGKPTEQSWAFSIINKLSSDPKIIFIRLTETGSYYGLIGLRNYDIALCRKLSADFHGAPIVLIAAGDSLIEQPSTEFIATLLSERGDKFFNQLIWTDIPEWTSTTRARDAGK